MKTLLRTMLVLACPLFLFAEDAAKAPANKTLNAYRIYAKDGKDAALRAGIAAHVAKFHNPNWKWRVSEVLTGPDSGSYMITEGPYSWTALDDRGDLGPEHQKDYDTNITPYVEKTTPTAYETYEDELSTVAPGAFAPTKTLISHVFAKPGRGPSEYALLKQWKKVWEKRGINVGVWTSFFSGEAQFTVVYRLKNGWKDLDSDTMGTRAAADAVYGPGGYERLMEETTRNVDHSYGEMIEFKAELSSK